MRLNRYPQDIPVGRLYAANQGKIRDYFQRLDIRSRRARFCGAVSDDRLLDYARTSLVVTALSVALLSTVNCGELPFAALAKLLH